MANTTEPLVSLITVCFNSENYIRDTLESVISQNYTLIEYIVIDGGSTDNTLNIIRTYERKFRGRLKWISEPDRGIYDAMNKGVQMATGEIVGILNSDDMYKEDDVINQVVEKFKHTRADCVYADLEYVDTVDTDRVVRRWTAKSGSFVRGWNPPHPSTFIRKDVYEKFGLYKVDYKISSDYDLLFRVIHKGKARTAYLNKSIVKMRVGGTSTSGFRSNIIASKEIYKTLKEYDEPLGLLIVLIRLARKIIQYV